MYSTASPGRGAGSLAVDLQGKAGVPGVFGLFGEKRGFWGRFWPGGRAGGAGGAGPSRPRAGRPPGWLNHEVGGVGPRQGFCIWYNLPILKQNRTNSAQLSVIQSYLRLI